MKVNVAGNWKAVKAMHVNVGNVWKPFYQKPDDNIIPGTKYSGVMIVGTQTDQAFTYYGYSYGAGSPSPTTLKNGKPLPWIYVQSQNNTRMVGVIANGNGGGTALNIRIDNQPAIQTAVGEYDSKLDITSWIALTPAAGSAAADALFNYMASKNGMAVALNID